jgi:hypothetical protein
MRSCTGSRLVSLSFAVVAALFTQRATADNTPPTAAPTPAQQPAPHPAETPQAPTGGDHPAPNSIYLEGLGAGLAYSVNYERMVSDDVGVRLGFSYMSFGGSATAGGQTSSASATFVTIPITASYTGIRAGSSALELGGGTTIAYASGSASGVGASASGSGMMPYGVVMVGYRLHPLGHPGFQFRVGAMAIIGEGLGLSNPDPSSIGVLPWGYLSLGASF